ASLLRLIAENRLNSGHADQAARLYRAAGSFSTIDDPSGPDPRVYLRLGRLVEARALLEGQLLRDQAAPAGGRRPEGHREPALLHGFSGEIAAARADAQAGLAIVEHSGDAWTAARLWTVLGAIGASHGLAETEVWLQEALKRHQACKDTYSQAVVLLYLSIWR